MCTGKIKLDTGGYKLDMIIQYSEHSALVSFLCFPCVPCIPWLVNFPQNGMRTTDHTDHTENQGDNINLCSEYWIIMSNLYPPVSSFILPVHTRLPAFLYTSLNMLRGFLQVSAGFCRPMAQKPPGKKVRKLKGFGAVLQVKRGFCTFCTILCACFYETGIIRLIDWKMLGYCL